MYIDAGGGNPFLPVYPRIHNLSIKLKTITQLYKKDQKWKILKNLIRQYLMITSPMR